MYSLMIQGTHAPGFQFKSNSGQEFRSLVESITLKQTTIICSPYRTDLLYYSDKDQQDDILKLWCKIVDKEYSKAIKNRFLKSNGELEAMQNYFTSLIYLARMPKWFQPYKKQLDIAIRQEPQHPIHRKILGCADFLVSKAGQQNFLNLKPDRRNILYFLSKGYRDFAKRAKNEYLNN